MPQHYSKNAYMDTPNAPTLLQILIWVLQILQQTKRKAPINASITAPNSSIVNPDVPINTPNVQ